MNKRLSIYLLLCSISCALWAQHHIAATDTDNIQVSLLTCDAGQEIYSLFGHTAIRYQDATRGIDAVFNYGVFNFDSPNFFLRFALGDAEYILQSVPFSFFIREYTKSKRKVWEQRLNLQPEEKAELIKDLAINAQPENRSYHYNFFYDNCATRPRDRVEDVIRGQVVYPKTASAKQHISFRSLIHQYTQKHPWERFGIDLCLGKKADQVITAREAMFIPFNLQRDFSTAQIAQDSIYRPLVCQEKILLDFPPIKRESKTNFGEILSPFRTFLLLFIVVCILTITGLKRQESLWGIDIILFTIAGIAGCVLTFLVFFSQHPTVDNNYLLFVFHPFHLIFLPWIIKAYKKKKKSPYNMANCLILTLFIAVFPILPQRIDFAIVPLALCLLIRSINQLILAQQKQG